jgi:hypothetical protein
MKVIARGEHLEVLRSPEFARKIWRMFDFRPGGATEIHVTAERRDRWKRHWVHIQGVDPLEYLVPFIR